MTVIIEDEETERKLQKVAREQFIYKMLLDLNMDMQICKLKGWDIMEYPRRIFDEVARVIFKYEVVKDCKGKDREKYAPTPQCGNCDALCGFYRDTCPKCGAKLDRSNIERIEVKA